MASIVVSGGRRLCGSISVSGAKNAALPILAASLLTKAPVKLESCPHLRDVDNMLAILEELGVEAVWRDGRLELDSSRAHSYVMPQVPSKELRSSIFMLGSLLGRFGHAVCTFPGGCEIGHRPIDLHIKGLTMLGADVREVHGLIVCDGENLTAADIHLDYPSVGATENIIMAAVGAEGETLIHNAAREPEIEDLQTFLNAQGHEVSGAGSSTVRIFGKRPVRDDVPVQHRIMPDRIVAGTLLCAAAVTGGEITLTGAVPTHLGSVIAKLREAGCQIYVRASSIRLTAPEKLNEIKLIETLPYPGFPTDMQAQFFALCCVARGTSVIVENVFENRFKHGSELQRMGAIFTQKDRTIIIRGVEKLTGAHVSAKDLRGGAALTIAGLAAEGETVVENAEFIDRGYEKLEEMFETLGADIRREG
ncbi:MAG TPA: UDP-N-acetylglucosamine 1-carboxyvinyltransferase [Clostridia bacterium]|nr:UDP-N-acetylglucosamine 1-carboxyvinyltransferase [Clostridia bacterium]